MMVLSLKKKNCSISSYEKTLKESQIRFMLFEYGCFNFFYSYHKMTEIKKTCFVGIKVNISQEDLELASSPEFAIQVRPSFITIIIKLQAKSWDCFPEYISPTDKI